jgi:TolA-binding protein
LLEKYPDDPLAAEAALVRGQALEKLGQSDPALAMYHLVIEKYPQSRELPRALWSGARLHDKLHQFSPAAELYGRLVEEHPKFGDADAALYHWAFVLRELDENEKADALFERLRRDYADSRLAADATYRLAERALARKQYDRTEKLLDELLSAGPPDSVRQHALYLQGRLAIARDAWDQVRPALERLVREFPESRLALPAQYWCAEAIYRQGDYRQAEQRFAKLASQSQGQPEKWLAMVPLRRAQSLAQLKEWQTALDVARPIEKDFPDFDQQYEVDYLIGRALASQADFAGAREHYAKVIRSSQGGKTETAAMAQWMIGETYFHQENYEAALREYLRVEILYAYPRSQAGALLQAGKCHELLGQWKQAIELYARLLKSYPDTEFTDEATRRLGVAQQRAATKRRT